MRIRQFIYFTLLIFSPILLLISIFLSVFALDIFIASEAKQKLFSFLLMSAIVLIPLGLSYFCYRLCLRAKSWPKRIACIYLTWLVLGFMGAYLVSAALAGVSMAVVEGVTKGWDLLSQELLFTGKLLLLAQVLVIPWIGIAIMLMKANEPIFFAQPNS